jgi:hypothetical protein
MNTRQRAWLATCLFVIGAAVAAVALQWDARPPRESGIPVALFYNSNSGSPVALPPGMPPPPPGFVIIGETLRHGIYVRRGWGADALLWGGFVPLVFFAAAGFVALGRAEKRA